MREIGKKENVREQTNKEKRVYNAGRKKNS
jgi:hypothetical protein